MKNQTRFNSFTVAAIVMLMCGWRAMAQTDVSDDGDVLQAQTAMSVEPVEEPVKFVSPATVGLRSFAGGELFLRSDATVSDSAIKLKNICRWPDSDAAFFASVGDLTVTRFPDGRLYATVTMDQVRAMLRGAGMNLAMVSLGGAISCAVNRPEDQLDEQQALSDWVDSRQAVPAAATQSPAPAPAAAADPQPLHSLRQILTDDLCRRLELDPKSVEMTFNSSDDKVLNLVEPYFQFEVTPRGVRVLGDLSWDVVIVAGGERHKARISASARVWQSQAVLANPLAYRQVIRDQDVQENRVLTDQLPTQTLLTKAQAVGQEAAHDLKPGTILASDMVDPALLARPGQLITINVVHGRIRITAVAKAIEGGSYGQIIRVRNDLDPSQIYDVTLTGPQTGTVVSGLSGIQDASNASSPSPIAAAAN